MSLTTLGAEAVLGFHPRWAGKNVREPFVRVARPLVGVLLALLVFPIVLSLPAALGSAVPPPALPATPPRPPAGGPASPRLHPRHSGGAAPPRRATPHPPPTRPTAPSLAEGG